MIRSIDPYNKSLLVQMNLFKNVALESIEVYLHKCEYRTLITDEILLSPNKENNHIFLLFTGRLTVHLDSVDNSPIATLEPGECVGEISIINNEAPSVYVVAAEKSQVLVINQETLWSLVSASHAVARNLLYILSRRMCGGIIALRDIPELNTHLGQDSVFDALTGLYNCRWLNEMFERILMRCMFNNKPLSLVMLSVDHFKDFIFQHGCLAGDLALCTVAGTLRRHKRLIDIAVRFSGEQFALVLPDTKREEALLIAERLKREVADTKINIEGRFNLSFVTASIGIAEVRPPNTLESILAEANAALARANDHGGNCISL